VSIYVHRSTNHRRSGEGVRQTVAVIALGALFAFGLHAIGGYAAPKHRAVAVASNDDEIYTGSILYMPIEGRICHQFLFDNRTGRWSDNGDVDCERSAYHANPKNWSFARARAISAGFRDHGTAIDYPGR